MARNQEGEFELVLGNKQLLSLFFLVVVLFAVFFSLGYMVGKSVAPFPSSAATNVGVSPAAGGGEPAPSPVKTAREEAREPAGPVTETQPARGEPQTATSQSARLPAEPPPSSHRPPNAAQVASQLHLQVAAVRVKADAEALVASLQNKGYKALLHAGAPDNWYRVVIGPFDSDRAAQEMKAQLEKDGYKSILKRP